MNNLSLIRKAVSFLILLLAFTGSAYAQIPKPMDSTYVNDFAKVLTKKQISSLNEQLHKLERERHLQVAIVLVKKLPETYEIEDFSLLIGRKWQVGEQGRGLVYVAAIKQRKQRLEVGRAMEATFNDVANTAMLNDIKPFFRNEDYAGGLQSLVTNISQLAQPPVIEKPNQLAVVTTPVAAKPKKSNGNNLWWWLGGFGLLILIVKWATTPSTTPRYQPKETKKSPAVKWSEFQQKIDAEKRKSAAAYNVSNNAYAVNNVETRVVVESTAGDYGRNRWYRNPLSYRAPLNPPVVKIIVDKQSTSLNSSDMESDVSEGDSSDYGRSTKSSSSSSGSGYSGSGTTSDW